MSIAQGFQPLILQAAMASDAEQANMVRALEDMGPAALIGAYIATAEVLKTRQLEGIGDIGSIDGFFDKIKKFASKIGNGVKKVVQTAAPVAAPFLSLIPGIGPGLAAGASALALPSGATPQQAAAIFQSQQQAAASQIRVLAGAFGSGQIDPAALAQAKKERDQYLNRLRRVTSLNKANEAKVNELTKKAGTIFGVDKKIAIPAMVLGVYLIARRMK